MKIEDILNVKGRTVETIEPGATLLLVVHKLATLGIGALVVSSDGERLDGMISDREVVRGLAKQGPAILEMRASDLAYRGGPVCAPADSVKDVMAKMTRTRNRHVPVVDEGRLRGLVSIGDVVKSRLDEMELETSVLRDAYIARR